MMRGPIRAYAGIGSRDTPPDVLEIMEAFAGNMAGMPWILRSGAAHGADAAFEKGATEYNGRREIYLPWPSYNGHHSRLEPIHAAYVMAKPHHPTWDKLTDGTKKMMARNAHILLGPMLRDPVKFVFCWTPNGKVTGGTGMSIRMAQHYGIPVYNIGNVSMDHIEQEIIKIISS